MTPSDPQPSEGTTPPAILFEIILEVMDMVGHRGHVSQTDWEIFESIAKAFLLGEERDGGAH